jgi:hypothetical protein
MPNRCHNGEGVDGIEGMRFTVSSGAGQVLATGSLFIQPDETGEPRLCFMSDRGTLIEGGKIPPDGDLAEASQELYRQFFRAWA